AAVDPVPEKPADTDVWTPEQVAHFVATHHDHRLIAAFYLLITAGLRRGELLGLRWQDFDQGGIRVRQTVSVVRNKAVIKVPKTRASRRYVALPPDTLAVLAAHRQRQEAAKQILGSAWQHPELVFPTEIGTVMHPRNFYRTWKKAVADAG